MNFAIRTFLNDKSKADVSIAMVQGTSEEGYHNYSLTVGFGKGTVTIHNHANNHDVARELFTAKLIKVRDTLTHALSNVYQRTPRCVRVWLNGESEHDREFTGNVCWSTDDKYWMISMSDCQRAIRIHLLLDGEMSDAYKAYVEEQCNKIRNLLKFIDQAINLLNNKQ